MRDYVIRRLIHTLIVMLGVVIAVFALIRFIPGDPAIVILGVDASPEEVERLQRLLGLNQPLRVQFTRYLSLVVRGDFGDSIFQHQPVMELIVQRLPATVELAVAAMLIAIILGVFTGVISAIRPYSIFDAIGTFIALAGVAMPVFWLGMLAILFFSLRLGWFPSFGRGEGVFAALLTYLRSGNIGPLGNALRHLALPALTLGAYSAALIARLVRSSMLEVLGKDYILTARGKGLTERTVILSHAFRNALIPVVTVIGLQVGALLGGAVITETIFSWPGLGRMLINAISQRDYPLIQGIVFFLALTISLINLLVDLLYAWLDPRVAYD